MKHCDVRYLTCVVENGADGEPDAQEACGGGDEEDGANTEDTPDNAFEEFDGFENDDHTKENDDHAKIPGDT